MNVCELGIFLALTILRGLATARVSTECPTKTHFLKERGASGRQYDSPLLTATVGSIEIAPFLLQYCSIATGTLLTTPQGTATKLLYFTCPEIHFVVVTNYIVVDIHNNCMVSLLHQQELNLTISFTLQKIS